MNGKSIIVYSDLVFGFRNDRALLRLLIWVTLFAIAEQLGACRHVRLRPLNTALPIFLIDGQIKLLSMGSA